MSGYARTFRADYKMLERGTHGTSVDATPLYLYVNGQFIFSASFSHTLLCGKFQCAML